MKFVVIPVSLDDPNAILCFPAATLGSECSSLFLKLLGNCSLVSIGGSGIGGAGPKVGDIGILVRLTRLEPPLLLFLIYKIDIYIK